MGEIPMQYSSFFSSIVQSGVRMVVIVVRGSGSKQCVWWNLKSILDQVHTAVVTQPIVHFQICIFHFPMVTAADRSGHASVKYKNFWLSGMVFNHLVSMMITMDNDRVLEVE